MDVKALQARLAAFAAERGWDDLHNPRNLAIALAGEAAMLLDLFRWLTDAQSQRIASQYKREAAEEAIADLILHTLRLADKLGVDVERAVAKKLAENDANYPPPVAEPVARAERPPAASPVVAPAPKPAPEKKESLPPVEQKKAPPPPEPAEVAPAPEAKEPKRAVEAPKAAPDKALPTWLDGIMPARSAAGRKKSAAAARPAPGPPKAPEPPRAPEPPPPPPAPRVVEEIDAAPPPIAAEPEPIEPPPPPEPPEPERYAHLDTDAAKGFAKALAKRVDAARSDDPLLRELHDEVETLRRTLYSPTPKRSWMGESLKTIRAILEEAATHSVGEEIRALDHIAQIDRMLNS
jgi:NTP pyrophosphatase (non-canonical NTP hydrolase)